jgi:hypothetical protein
MKLAPPQKRGLLRAIIAGIVAHYLIGGALILSYWLLRPFVWAALYGVPYPAPQGPYDPSSGEWLFVQAMGLVSWIAAGAATARWSNPGFPAAAVVLVLLCFALLFFESPMANVAIWRMALYYLEIPVGLIVGVVAYDQYQRGATVVQHDT